MPAPHATLELARDELAPLLRGHLRPGNQRPDGFNHIATGEPLAVVAAAEPADVVETVRFAAHQSLPIAVQATGHGPPPSLEEALLLDTSALGGVAIDPQSRTARIEAGVPWSTVIHAAAAHGLAPLNGASPSVGAVGYILGGGHGPLGRSYGYAADHVRGINVVTPDGTWRTTAPDTYPDLFWALRGGKGNFGVVTAMTIDLFDVPALYGGGLFLPVGDPAQTLRAWRDWTRSLPDAMHTALSLTRFPDDPGLPDPIRGRFLVHLRIAYNGPAEQGRRLLAPMRALAEPVLDTVRWMPYTSIADVHLDPTTPGVYYERSRLLADLPDDAIDTLAALTGPDGVAPLPTVELRLLGGAFARTPEAGNAVPFRDAGYTLFSGARVTPDGAARVRENQQQLVQQLGTWARAGAFLSYLSPMETSPEQVRSAYDPDTYAALRDITDRYDPANLMRTNHNIPPHDSSTPGTAHRRNAVRTDLRSQS